MPSPLPILLALVCLADPPSPAPIDVVAAVESVVADAIAAAEGSVVAVARDKSENDETTAVRGLAPRGNSPGTDRRMSMLMLNNPTLLGADNLSFDYGSGVVVGPKGEILTAFHVVKGAARLTVRAAGRQTFEAEIIAADSRSDLAVIAPRETPGLPAPKLKPVKIGDASKLRKGSFLVALGNPFNAARDGRPSASWGILSNLARKIEPSLDDPMRQEPQLRNYPTLLQLDAKLNQGMSGGAVVNMKGELVGLTTAAANAAGFDAQAGYAIPMDRLGRQVVEALSQGKEYEYGFLGIKLDIEENTNRVGSADPGTPAADGGVQVNDLILAVGNMPVTDRDSLVVAINSVPAGETVRFKLGRRNAVIERDVQLAKLKVRSAVIATNRPEPWRGLRVDYTSTLAGAIFRPELMEAMARRGVVVTEVQTGSEAEKAGVRVGQVVSRVGGQVVSNPREFARVVAGLKGPATVETELGTVTVK